MPLAGASPRVTRLPLGVLQEDGLEDIGRILERIEDGSGSRRPGPPPLSSRKHVLYVEHRCAVPPQPGARAGLRSRPPSPGCVIHPVVLGCSMSSCPPRSPCQLPS